MRLITGLLLVAFLPHPVPAADKPLSEVTILGVGIKTTEAEFLKLHPDAAPFKMKTYDLPGVKSYAVVDESGSSAFTFSEGKLCCMLTTWKMKSVVHEKGWVDIVDKLTTKYGKHSVDVSSKNTPHAYMWANSDCLLLTMLSAEAFSVTWRSELQEQKLEKLRKKQP